MNIKKYKFCKYKETLIKHNIGALSVITLLTKGVVEQGLHKEHVQPQFDIYVIGFLATSVSHCIHKAILFGPSILTSASIAAS